MTIRKTTLSQSLLLGTVLLIVPAICAQNEITQPGDPIYASSSNSPDGEAVGGAIDNNQLTKYLNFDSGQDGNQIGTFSPSGFAVIPSVGISRVTGIRMQSANDRPERDPDTILLEGSNDTNITSYASGNWEAIVSITNIAAGFTARFQEQTFSFRNNRLYNAYRWTVQRTRQIPNGCCMQIAEVELLGALGPQNVNQPYDVTLPDDVILASSENSPILERVWNAIDNTTATKYLNFDSGRDGDQIGTFSPSGFVVTPAVGKTCISGITMQSANDFPDRDPDVVALFGSNDTNITNYASGTWEHITTISNIAAGFTARFQEQTFLFQNTKPYRSYKWEIQRVRVTPNGCCMQVAEVQLLGSIATTLQEPVIGAGSLSITAETSPGGLLLLNRNYTNAAATIENPIRLGDVDNKGLTHFTVDEHAGNAFFRARTISTPIVLGGLTNPVKVFAFPQDITVTNTGRAAFMVVAEGTITNELHYQWLKNGSIIPGATNSTYTIESVGFADAGVYSCDVNMVGHPAVSVGADTAGSTGAKLSVNVPPVPNSATLGDGLNAIIVIAFPEDTIVSNTATAAFTVAALGTVTNVLQYQWFRNEIPLTNDFRISGANSTNLVIQNAHFDPGETSPIVLSTNTDVGFYSCAVNMIGHPAVRVRSAETNAPGARLFVYVGTNTTIYAVYQTGSGSICLGRYSGFVKFRNEVTGTFLFYKTPGKSFCSLTDLTSVMGGYNRKLHFSNAAGDACSLYPPSYVISNNNTPLTFKATDFPYQFTIYVTDTFPTGAQFALDVRWF